MTGSLIIIIGVGIFGTFTRYLANLFLSPANEPDAERPDEGTDDTQTKLAQLKVLLAQQQQKVDEIDLLLRPDGT